METSTTGLYPEVFKKVFQCSFPVVALWNKYSALLIFKHYSSGSGAGKSSRIGRQSIMNIILG